MASCSSNCYTNPHMEIISPSGNVLNLGIYMTGDCTFDYHISNLSENCANFSRRILITFYTRDCITLLTLFKSIVHTVRITVMVSISGEHITQLENTVFYKLAPFCKRTPSL